MTDETATQETLTETTPETVAETPTETSGVEIPEIVEHPAQPIIREIEYHLAHIPAFGFSEQAIRKCVEQLKEVI